MMEAEQSVQQAIPIPSEFFACYLLTSLQEKAKGRTYIGFTVNPGRRLRQHNGLILNGAKRTSRLRPWQMLLLVHGFPSKFSALQFEWAWQNPHISRLLKNKLPNELRSKKWSIRAKVRAMRCMLTILPWCRYPLTLHIIDPSKVNSSFKDERKDVPLPPLPEHTAVTHGPLSMIDVLVADSLNSEEADKDIEDDDGDPEGDAEEPPRSSQAEAAVEPKSDEEDLCDIFVISSSEGSDNEHTQTEHSSSQSFSSSQLPPSTSSSPSKASSSQSKGRPSPLCYICGHEIMTRPAGGGCCSSRFHLSCFAAHFRSTEVHRTKLRMSMGRASDVGVGPEQVDRMLIPMRGACPSCKKELFWAEVVRWTRFHANVLRRPKRGRAQKEKHVNDAGVGGGGGEEELQGSQPLRQKMKNKVGVNLSQGSGEGGGGRGGREPQHLQDATVESSSQQNNSVSTSGRHPPLHASNKVAASSQRDDNNHESMAEGHNQSQNQQKPPRPKKKKLVKDPLASTMDDDNGGGNGNGDVPKSGTSTPKKRKKPSPSIESKKKTNKSPMKASSASAAVAAVTATTENNRSPGKKKKSPPVKGPGSNDNEKSSPLSSAKGVSSAEGNSDAAAVSLSVVAASTFSSSSQLTFVDLCDDLTL
mmetsp:Transcript_30678/g.51640  ORF Transcript_30678/g.51640 Transcript_30678/m.51640 type:complete len:643 (+) Transcript_30678:27-1955(+)